MTKKIFIKEIKDYSAIFAFICIIFMIFHNNMTFAKSTCKEQDGYTALDRCRTNSITVAPNIDIDGNKPVVCGDVEWDSTFNPYMDDEYYYEQKNKWCLAWGLGISLSYAVLAFPSSFSCLIGGAAPKPDAIAQKLTKMQKLKKGWTIFKQVLGGTAQIAAVGAASAFTNPIIALQGALALDVLSLSINMAANITLCVGMNPAACTMIGVCAGWIVGLAAAAQLLIFSTTGGLYESAKKQINNIKVCGDDWYSYAYTGYDMKKPEIEWYPQYDSFSNSYSYKVKKALSGQYKCSGYLVDDTKYNGGNQTSELSGCPSDCQQKVEECLRKNRNSEGSGNEELCLMGSNGCSEYCRGYYIKCKPMLEVLDGDGICVDNPNSSNPADKIDCKGVKPNYKNSRNRVFREVSYKGKEFKIATDAGDQSNCYDPRIPQDRGYGGLEQRYYYKGKDSAQYACNRFDYKNTGCLIYENGHTKLYTKSDVSNDKNKSNECKKAFKDAKNCCQMRRTLGICIYAQKGKNAGRNTNTMCLRSLDPTVETKNCQLPTGETSIRNPIFRAYTPESSSTLTCIKNVNFCPYSYNVAGGTELEELYCEGDYLNCVNPHDTDNNKICNDDDSDESKCENWQNKYGKDKAKIWKYGVPTASYGQTKNFCYYRANCTEIGDSEYDFADMTANKFLPKVCSDFIGDSQNLPTPVGVLDLNMSSSVNKIFSSVGVNLGDGNKKDVSAAINKMNSNQIAVVYSKIIAEKAIISVALGLTASLSGPLAGIILGASAGTLYTIQDIQAAITNEGDAKKTLNSIVNTLLTQPIIDTDFSMGSYRGFTAPIAQCVRETLYNMFHNVAGRSLCKDSSEYINSEGLCGNDTFGPPIKIRNKNFSPEFHGDTDAYYYVIGEQLPPDSNIFHKIQSRVQLIIKLAAVLAIILIALKFLMKGDVDIFDIKKPKAVIVGMLKFAIVFYFSIGNAWQSQFYDWVDKGTQYLYYKSFNLALVNYSGYRSISNKVVCDKKDITSTCNTTPEINKCDYFDYNQNIQTFVVPDRVKNVKIEIWGAEGGSGSQSLGGKGGYSYGTLDVNPGDVLKIKTGGTAINGTGGSNGGGNSSNNIAGGGGGRTEVSKDNVLLIVAGGGGGAGSGSNNSGGSGGGANFGGGTGEDSSTCGGLGGKNGLGATSLTNCPNSKFNPGSSINGGNSTINDIYLSGAGGGGYGGGAGGSFNNGGGGGGGYINSILKFSGGSNGVNSDSGKVNICYTIPKKDLQCENVESVTKAFEVQNVSVLPYPIPNGNVETCLDSSDINGPKNVTKKTCYSNCLEVQKFSEDGTAIYEYSTHYDGCYFGDNNYPSGKQYLAIFDSLDCKLMNYLNYGPDMDLPGIIHMLLISLILGPLALVTIILGSLLFVILLIIVVKVLYTFLMSMIAINIMIYLSPLIFPTILFEKYKSIFTKWLDNFMSFCLQFIFVLIYAGFFIGSFERFAIGSAQFVGHDPTTGRLPMTICGDTVDSVLCIFKVNTNKGTKPLAGETVGKILGIGPVISVIESISQNFVQVVVTLFKFCLITFVLLQFLKKIPDVAAELTGGKALKGGDLSLTDIMKKISDTANTVSRGAKGIVKKGAGAIKGAKDKIKGGGKAGDPYNKDNKDDKKGKKGDENSKDKLSNVSAKKQDSGGSKDKKSKDGKK